MASSFENSTEFGITQRIVGCLIRGWLKKSNIVMGLKQNTVHYCSVSKGGQVLYSHSVGDQEIEKFAALCLDQTPPYHKCYFQTMGKKTYGYLIEDVHVYFAIADKDLCNFGVLQFLKHVRDEYKRLSSKKCLKKSLSGSLSIQEQLVPIIHRLITSLQQVSQNKNEWPPGASSVLLPSLSAESNGEFVASTKAPLLSKSGKKEKKKKKNHDHVIGMRGIEIEEHRSSSDRVAMNEINSSDSTSSLNREVTYVRTRSINGSSSSRRSIQKKWCRILRIVLAIDIVVCLVLLAVWLVICGGIKCLH